MNLFSLKSEEHNNGIFFIEAKINFQDKNIKYDGDNRNEKDVDRSMIKSRYL